LGVVVEVVQGGRGGQVREPEPAGEPPCFGGLHLDAEQLLQCCCGAELLGLRGVQHGGQGFGGVGEFEVGQVPAELLVAAGLGGGRWHQSGVLPERFSGD